MTQQPPSTSSGEPGVWSQIPLWKKVTGLLAIGVMALGVTLNMIAPGDADDGPTPRATDADTARGTDGSPSVTPRGFGPAGSQPGIDLPFPPTTPEEDDDPDADRDDRAGDIDAEQHPLDLYSPAIFRLGFSFFLGFAIATALRMVVKLTLVGVGLFAMGLFGLQYAGFVEVNWTAIGDRYDSFAAWFTGQFESFTTFIAGYVPSIGAGLGGAFLGFKKK
jgi:uncharacterized membrane protein (Fun14 family)